MYVCVCVCVCVSIYIYGGSGLVAKSCPIFVTPWTVAHQASLTLGFPKREYWRGLPFPPPGDLPSPGIESGSPTLQVDFVLLTELPKKPMYLSVYLCIYLSIYICVYICLYIYIYIYIYTHTYIYIYIYMCIYMYI